MAWRIVNTIELTPALSVDAACVLSSSAAAAAMQQSTSGKYKTQAIGLIGSLLFTGSNNKTDKHTQQSTVVSTGRVFETKFFRPLR